MTELADGLLPLVRAYVAARPEVLAPPVAVRVLAQGEYNVNFLATSGAGVGGGDQLVVRVSTGSQEIATGDEQILYEAGALRVLAPLGLAPGLVHVDASRREVPYGLLIEEFLPGGPLDYASDAHLRGAAKALAALHTFEPPKGHGLAVMERPLSEGLALGAGMLAHYREAPEASSGVLRILDAAERGLEALVAQEERLFRRELRGIVHTDVQAHNFIVREAGGGRLEVRLVDWEKPVLDDPTYDLAHFLTPTTTRWKCGVDLRPAQRGLFLEAYVREAEARRRGFTEGLEERLRVRQPFVYWRAITWCAMAWVEYSRPGRAIKNADTFARIEEYLQTDFLEGLFGEVI